MKLKETNVTKVVDYQTGEEKEIEVNKTFVTKVTPDKFYMTFIDYAAPLFQIKSETAKSVLTWMCCHLPYNDNKIPLTTKMREQLCKDLNITPNTLTNSLKKLKDLNVINGSKGDFEINPAIHWRGTTDERDKKLKVKEIQVMFNIKFEE